MKSRVMNWLFVVIGIAFIVSAAIAMSSYWTRGTPLEHVSLAVPLRARIAFSCFLAAIGLWCLLGGIRNIRGTPIVATASRTLNRLVIGNIVALLGLVAGEYVLFLLVPNDRLPFFGVFAAIFHYGILLSLLMTLLLSAAWLFNVPRRKKRAA